MGKELDKTMVCMLVSFLSIFAILPVVMLSMITILPQDGVPYMFSTEDAKNRQSLHAVDGKACTETELFHNWHALAHIEEKLLQKVNASNGVHYDEEESPQLLSVDAAGQLKSEVQQKTVKGPAQPPSSTESLGDSPTVLEAVVTSTASSQQGIEQNKHTQSESHDEPTSSAATSQPPSTMAENESKRTASHPELRWVVKNDARGGFMQKRVVEPRSIIEAELDGSHWVGRVPKVTCIMGLPSTSRAYAQLKYAVDNFRAQKYEGQRQLIIVYHYQDQEARKRIRRLSRGGLIKGVPARTMEVPSSTAMRFGAWAADADTDIIARWDVDNWHSPNQLSMQIRGLTLSGRKACLLKSWTVAPAGEDRTVVAGEIGGEHTLMGHKAWMEENWEPFLPDGLGVAVLQAFKGSLALLDMPDLLVHHPDPLHEEEEAHHAQPGDKLHAYLAIRHAQTESQ